MKLTGWYSGDQKPVRDGVYQRFYDVEEKRYCFFDGISFYVSSWDVDMANRETLISTAQNLRWRGVSK